MNEKVKALEELRARLRANAGWADPQRVMVGDYTYGQPLVLSWGEDTKLTIGKFCSIGSNVQIFLGGNHHTDWLTTYPFNVLLKDQWPRIDGEVAATKGDVIIGNDVWIANDAVILSGVTIGDGAVIGARAVVTRDVPAYSIMAGNPAEQKGFRWSAAATVDVKWWDLPEEQLAEIIPMLMSENSFALRMWKENLNGPTVF